MAQDAYNPCVLPAGDGLEETVGFCKAASALRPEESGHACTLALYSHRKGETAEEIAMLKTIIG